MRAEIERKGRLAQKRARKYRQKMLEDEVRSYRYSSLLLKYYRKAVLAYWAAKRALKDPRLNMDGQEEE